MQSHKKNWQRPCLTILVSGRGPDGTPVLASCKNGFNLGGPNNAASLCSGAYVPGKGCIKGCSNWTPS